MSAHVPLVILPRELGQVPPPLQLVGHKARGLAQLLALKARVPRFGILTAEAFDAHMEQDDVRAPVAAAVEASRQGGASWDEAGRLAHADGMVRAVLRSSLPVAVRIGLQELLAAFADDDVLAVRASVVGEPVEAAVVAGALDSALGIKGREALEEAVLRIIALAVHPRTLALREQGGLPPVGCRLAIVVQRMVQSESSGVCASLEAALPDTRHEPSRPARSLIRGCWGLAGGLGGRQGSSPAPDRPSGGPWDRAMGRGTRMPADVVHVERPAAAGDGIDEAARVETQVALKESQLKLDDTGKGTRMQAVSEHLKRECCLTAVQSRMVAREALRLEAALGKPQLVSWAFAGRLLHVLDVEPLLVPVSRVESERARTWDDRLLPAGLLGSTTPLTFSVWQRASARGVERAGRILGVKGVILEDTRPQMPRLVGHVGGRVYGNLEVLSALVDLLPFADKARAALAAATGQGDLVPRHAPPPGFWQRQRQKLDEGRWPGQLERLSEMAAGESARFGGEVEEVLSRSRSARAETLDPDTLIDAFDELEDALSKMVAALALSGLAATLHQRELDAVIDETELKEHAGLVNDLVAGDPPAELVERSRQLFSLVEIVRARPDLAASLAARHHLERFALRLLEETDEGLASDDERALATGLRALLATPAATCTGELTLEAARPGERPDLVLEVVSRLVGTPAGGELIDELLRASTGARRKAEYALDQIGPRLKGSSRKRFLAALAGVRSHGRDVARGFLTAELVVERLRIVALALGARLFEHALLDQPRDVFHLTTPEMAGLVRGTGVDQDGKPLVAARKRQAAARPTGLPRRLETRGVVATSLWSDEDEPRPAPAATAPGAVREIVARAVSSGVVEERAVLLDGNPLERAAPAVPSGVVVLRALTLQDLPLCLVAKAVVAERGNGFGPAAWTLRALGVPTLVDAPQATATFAEGEVLVVDGGSGVVRRAASVPGDAPSDDERTAEKRRARSAVDPHIFAREAVLSDPRGRVRARAPAQAFADLPVPPLVRPPDSGRVESGQEPAPAASVRGGARRASIAMASALDDESLAGEGGERGGLRRARLPLPEIAPLSPRSMKIEDVETSVDEEDILETTDEE